MRLSSQALLVVVAFAVSGHAAATQGKGKCSNLGATCGFFYDPCCQPLGCGADSLCHHRCEDGHGEWCPPHYPICV
ncbi:hypothetical protein WAI453_001436 [Rhynchosporium graminicola]